jgi:pimeloyl-ACP methyl ester carboxylesterase
MTVLIIIAVVLLAGALVTLVATWLIQWRHPPNGRFVDVRGLPRHVLELGESSEGPDSLPVVLLHGAGANLKDMEVAVGVRLAARHRVILIDRPGFGFSARKKGGETTPTEQAVVLDELLSQLGIDRAIIVGHSWGGTLALTLALDFPTRVAGLVLIAAPTHPGLWGMAKLNAVLATPIGWLFARTLALPFGAIFIWPGSRTAFLPQIIPRGYIKRTAAMLVLRPKTLLANWSDVGCIDAFLAQQASRYGALAAPTIVLSGDRDPLVPPEKHAMKLAVATPVVKVEVLKGFGHMLHHAAADRVAAVVEEMSEGLRDRGAKAGASIK